MAAIMRLLEGSQTVRRMHSSDRKLQIFGYVSMKMHRACRINAENAGSERILFDGKHKGCMDQQKYGIAFEPPYGVECPSSRNQLDLRRYS